MLQTHIQVNKLLLAQVLCILFCSYWIFESYRYPPGDFANSYMGAYFQINEGLDADLFDPFTFNRKTSDAGFEGMFLSYNPNPPSAALLFTPFALLPIKESKLLFNCLSALLFLVTLGRLARHLRIETRIVLLFIPLIFFIPIRNQILFGQTYFLLLFLLSEGYLAYQKEKYPLASVLWAIAIFLKIFPAIVILLLISDKNLKASVWLSVTCLVGLILCVAIQGMDMWITYTFQVLPANLKGEITSSYATNYQSANALFRHLFVYNADLNPEPLLSSKLLFHLFDVLFKTFVLGYAVLFAREQQGIIRMGVLLLAGILISSYGSTYSNLLLLFILLPLSARWNAKSLWGLILILLAGNLPVSWFRHFFVLLQFPRLFLLCAVLVIVIMTAQPRLRLMPFVVFLLFFLIPVFAETPVSDKSVLLTTDKRHHIMYDYGLKDGHVFYSYWNERGTNTFVTSAMASTLAPEGVELLHNQIYFKNRQVTDSPDKKLKPMLMNGDTIVYLSDKDSGIGFYNLRIISLAHEPAVD